MQNSTDKDYNNKKRARNSVHRLQLPTAFTVLQLYQKFNYLLQHFATEIFILDIHSLRKLISTSARYFPLYALKLLDNANPLKPFYKPSIWQDTLELHAGHKNLYTPADLEPRLISGDTRTLFIYWTTFTLPKRLKEHTANGTMCHYLASITQSMQIIAIQSNPFVVFIFSTSTTLWPVERRYRF